MVYTIYIRQPSTMNFCYINYFLISGGGYGFGNDQSVGEDRNGGGL